MLPEPGMWAGFVFPFCWGVEFVFPFCWGVELLGCLFVGYCFGCLSFARCVGLFVIGLPVGNC